MKLFNTKHSLESLSKVLACNKFDFPRFPSISESLIDSRHRCKVDWDNRILMLNFANAEFETFDGRHVMSLTKYDQTFTLLSKKVNLDQVYEEIQYGHQ